MICAAELEVPQNSPTRIRTGITLPITAWLGQCSRCGCYSFRGSGNVCEDCGHHYDDHGTSPL
jgi:hypothetical protein